jgi:hypothetical protein
MIAALNALFQLLQVLGFIMFAFIAFFLLGTALHMVIYVAHNVGRCLIGKPWLPLAPWGFR